MLGFEQVLAIHARLTIRRMERGPEPGTALCRNPIALDSTLGE